LPAVNIGILRARSFLPSDVNFTVHYADSKCHIGVGINEAIKLWYAGKVHVFFGPVCDYAVAPVARQTRFWNIPIVSVGAMAAEFKKFHVEDYPTLTRAGAVDFTVFSALIHKFLDQFKWNKFKILYEQQGINVSDDFCKIMSSSIYYTPSNKRKDYFNLGDLGDLENIIISEIGIGYGVVVLCASADSVREIMIKAHELNFDNGEYVFLNIDLFSSKEDSEKPWYRENDTTERNQKAKKAYEALMTVTLRKPTSPEYRNFSEEVKKRAGNDSFAYGEDEVNSFVGAFHDAVILYALALNETLANNRSITNGTEITHRMWNRTFEGITGTVSIDSNGDRNADYSLLDMDPHTGKFEVVANYFGKDKKYVPVSNTEIHWAGNRKSAPPDTPKCGFDGAKCPPEKPFPEYGIVIIVLGSLLVIVVIAAFFIYRHIKLEAELAEMNWRVRWDDIMFGTMENDRKMRRQGSNLSLTRTTNGEACAEGRVLIERSD
uniref:Receptor ligand binding region domain-containing protein n=1 Tax=Magallana gigas TaxID=29159 RepID=A0A8W8P0H7_MAGGI